MSLTSVLEERLHGSGIRILQGLGFQVPAFSNLYVQFISSRRDAAWLGPVLWRDVS